MICGENVRRALLGSALVKGNAAFVGGALCDLGTSVLVGTKVVGCVSLVA